MYEYKVLSDRDYPMGFEDWKVAFRRFLKNMGEYLEKPSDESRTALEETLNKLSSEHDWELVNMGYARISEFGGTNHINTYFFKREISKGKRRA